MTGSRLALVAEDQRLASTIQNHLKKNLGQAVLQCSVDSIRNHLGRETDGLLLLAAASAAESEQILRLVQEIYLQKLPPIIVIVDGENSTGPVDLTMLDPYVAQRFEWPRDASLLVQFIRDRIGRVRDFMGSEDETIEQVISRRLLRNTPSLLPLVE